MQTEPHPGNTPGRLYLVPTPLGPDDDPVRVLPPATIEAIVGLDLFVAERARSARAVLGRLPMRRPIQAIEIVELNRNTSEAELPGLLAPLLLGRDAGLLSEAGCPAVADPGAALVALAHRHHVPVVPLVGPSALLLALMASGMNGQAFAFAGYVPVEPAQRAQRLRELERRSAANDETVLLIETPYRNQTLFDAMLEVLEPTTRVGVAARLTLDGERIESRPAGEWRGAPPVLDRTPTVFTLQAAHAARPRDMARPGGTRGGAAPPARRGQLADERAGGRPKGRGR